MNKSKRLKRLRISNILLCDWIKGKFPSRKVETNLPKNTKLLRVIGNAEIYDKYDEIFEVIVESKEFGKILSGDLIPYFGLEIKEIKCPITKNTAK